MQCDGRPVKAPKGDGELTPARNAKRNVGRRGGLVVPIDGDVLRERRLRAFLTQRELAELAGYSAAFVSELETGRYQPGIDCLRALAGALACEPAALMSSEPAA